MKRLGSACLVFFLLGPLWLAGRSPEAAGLARLKSDFSGIVCGLLACYEQNRERRFLEMALYFGEIRSHPIFDMSWGKRRQTAAAEERLLRAIAFFRERLGGCTGVSRESGRLLCRRAQEYIQAATRDLASFKKVALYLPGACDLDLLQKTLAPGQVLLKYILLEDRILLFYIGAEAEGYDFLAIGRRETVAMIDRLSEPLEDFASGRVDYLRIHFDMELAQRLFNVLLKRATERFPPADELFIIPDQELYKLPFDALVMGFSESFSPQDIVFSEYQAANYVIQKFKVSYFFSLADFRRKFSGPKEYPYALAAFGHPLVPQPPPGPARLGLRGSGSVADVPSTRQEILSLEKLFAASSHRVFLGADFTRGNFTRFAPQARVIHLASHFFNDPDDPSCSGFLFSAPGAARSLFAAQQIRQLRLRAELMVLSACESSEKNLLGFKLLGGMTAAIRQSGVRDLIASLWPVDEFSSQIVPLFYREYLDGGDSATALRNAKIALFAKTIALQDGVRLSLAHPFLWANYVLYHFSR